MRRVMGNPSTDYDALLRAEMEWAIQQKKRLGPKDEDAFRMRVAIVGPRGEIVETPLGWGDMAEKHRVMVVLSTMCRVVDAAAVLITTDSRYLITERFCEHFGLIVPRDPAEFADFNKERRRIMAEHDFLMEKLPRALWEEALHAIAYGPRIAKMCMTKYTAVGNHFVFQETEMLGEGDGRVSVPMIHAWWQ